MHRALRAAAICSVALHATALLCGQYALDGEARPSIASRVLVLTLAGIQIEQPGDAEQSINRDELAETPPAATVEAGSVAVADALGPARAMKNMPPVDANEPAVKERTGETGSAPAASAPTQSEPATPAASGNDDTRLERIALASTTAASAERVPEQPPPGAARVEPMSPEQQRMLDRKLHKWEESYERRRMDGTPWTYRGQDYVATFTPQPAVDDADIEHVLVEVSMVAGGRKLTTQVRMRRLAFSNYAQFVDKWDPDVGFHDDELDGRFHSNSQIFLNKDRSAMPTFYGKVTTAAYTVNFGDAPGYTRKDRIFVGGLETGVGSIQFPERFVPFPANSDAHARQVRYFDADTRITFHGDGSYEWRAVDSSSGTQRADLPNDAAYLIARGKAELHVAGIVNGKVLVYSPERIVIDGDVVCAQDPATSADSDDYLGLVSDKYVDIAPQEVTGPGDLSIDAAIYAKRVFAVKGYGTKNGGVLSVFGSLTAGSLSATEPRYRTRVHFDRRLEKLRPPAFPMTDRYEVESWDGVWRVESP